MIAHLKGVLSQKSPDCIILDVNGVGYQVFVPLSTLDALPEKDNPVSLRIHTYMREDAIKLFGFFTELEQLIFEKLISINKVGPKLALSILSGMRPQDLMSAIMSQDVARISTIPGVGRKTAERLTLEMRDKLANAAIEPVPVDELQKQPGIFEDALSALINLGYKRPDAEKALKSILDKNGKTSTLETLIKESLNLLS